MIMVISGLLEWEHCCGGGSSLAPWQGLLFVGSNFGGSLREELYPSSLLGLLFVPSYPITAHLPPPCGYVTKAQQEEPGRMGSVSSSFVNAVFSYCIL